MEQRRARGVEAARTAYEWLQERLAATQQEMREAQDRLFKSYQSQDLFVPEGSVSAVSTSIARLNEDFVQAQARRIAIETALKQAREMKGRGEGLDALPQVATDAGVNGVNSPRAVQIREGLEAEYMQLRKRETELRAAIDAQKAQAATQSRKVTELEALKKEAESAKSLYEVLLQKLKETDIAASIRSNNVTVVDRASPPLSPVRPRKQRIAAAGVLLGLLAGLGLVILRHYLAHTIP